MVCLSCWLTCRMFERLQKLLTYIFWQKTSSFVFCIGLGNLEGWETLLHGNLWHLWAFRVVGCLEGPWSRYTGSNFIYIFWLLAYTIGHSTKWPSNLVLKCLGSLGFVEAFEWRFFSPHDTRCQAPRRADLVQSLYAHICCDLARLRKQGSRDDALSWDFHGILIFSGF